MYLRVDIDDDCLCQWHQCDLPWLSSMLILIDTVVVLIIQDDNENVIVAYRTVSSMIMSLTVIATLIKMFWCTTTFWKECHTTCLTVDTTDRNQHTSTLNQNCIDVWWLMSPHLIWHDMLLYKQNIHTEQHKNDHCLRKISALSELLLINKENWIIISSCKSESDNVSIIQNESSTSCQLRDTYLYDTYMMIVVVVVVAAELVIWESVLTYSIKKDFTYKRCWWRSWRKKKKKSCTWGEGVYNSLHWQINSSELSEKITQAMKKFSPVNLTCTKQKNMCQQTLTTVQQPFQKLKAQPWRKRKRWCHKLNSY